MKRRIDVTALVVLVSLAAFSLALPGQAQVLYSTGWPSPPFTVGVSPNGIDGWANGSGTGVGFVISSAQSVSEGQSLISDNSSANTGFYSVLRDLAGWTAATNELLTVTARLWIDPSTGADRLYGVYMTSSPTGTLGATVLGLTIGGGGSVRAGTTWSTTYSGTPIGTVTGHTGQWLTVTLSYDPVSTEKTAAISGSFGTVEGSWTGGTLPGGMNLGADYVTTADRNGIAYFDDISIEQGGEQPEIDVSPASFTASQPPDTVTSQDLTISNIGESDLIWEIDEEPVAGPTSYPAELTNSPSRLRLPGQHSPKPWPLARSIRAVLMSDQIQDGGFEAGSPNPFWAEASTNFGSPLCTVASCGTGTGTGPRGGDWWVWFGGISAYEAGSVSQTVTIPAGYPATLSFWVEQFVCSGSVGDYLEVTLGGDQLWVTTGTDPACGTLGYREVTVDVSAYADGVPRTLAFNGETSGASSMNFFLDDVSLMAGAPPACSLPADVPWLMVEPAAGTTAPAASTPVTVEFYSAGLAAGLYEANLCVNSNDPVNSLVVVPVELEVTAPVAALVTVLVGPGGGGTVTGGGPYTIGEFATVQASPAPGWVFLHWVVDDVEITDNPYTFEVTGDITLTAIFAQQEIEAIPTTGTIGLVLLLALLAGVGVFVLRRM